MGTDGAVGRAAGGALAGALAGAVWLAQEPLDRRAFGFPYSDADLLGRAVTGAPAARPLGIALHLQNAALFGVAYALLRPRLPASMGRPGWAAGLAAGLGEHAISWQLAGLGDRYHPRRDWPSMAGDRRALAQATWRHALFGLLLGVAEQRLNRPRAGADPAADLELAQAPA